MADKKTNKQTEISEGNWGTKQMVCLLSENHNWVWNWIYIAQFHIDTFNPKDIFSLLRALSKEYLSKTSPIQDNAGVNKEKVKTDYGSKDAFEGSVSFWYPIQLPITLLGPYDLISEFVHFLLSLNAKDWLTITLGTTLQ